MSEVVVQKQEFLSAFSIAVSKEMLILGETVKQSFLRGVALEQGIPVEKVLVNPVLLGNSLEKTFGPTAQIIERKIIHSMCQMLHLHESEILVSIEGKGFSGMFSKFSIA